jgi:hypothetical protein
MALTERTPFRIARRFWHGWTQALPAHLVLATGFTFAFNPITTTPLLDAQGVMPNHVALSIALSTFLVFLSWAIGGHSMRTGYAFPQTLRAAFPLLARALTGMLLFLLAVGAPVVQGSVQQGGFGLALAAGGLAFGFFLYLEWSMLERTGHTPTPTVQLPVWKAIPLALWADVLRTIRFVRGVWKRTPLALACLMAGLFVLSLVLLPVTALLSLLWPMPPVWAGLFFSFLVLSAMPSLAAAALADARGTPPKLA